MMDLEEWGEPDYLAATDACLSGCVSFSQGKFFSCSFSGFCFELKFAYKLPRVVVHYGSCKTMGQILDRQENSFVL